MTQARADHRHHRPGRRLSGRAAAGQGLRGARPQAPRLVVQHRPDRPSLPGPARAPAPGFPALWRPDRRHQPDPHRAGGAAATRSTTWPPRATSRSASRRPSTPPTPTALGTLRLLEAIRILKLEGTHPLLPGQHLRALRRGARRRRARRTPFLPQSPYATAKLYAYWITRTTATATACSPATASCSTTRARSAARPSSPARSPGRWPRSSSACRTGCGSAISTPGATGAMPATMSRACGASCSTTSADD